MTLNESSQTQDIFLKLTDLNLTAAETRIARYILSVPEHEVAVMTTQQLAERCGTSRSTVVRLLKKWGMDGLGDLKRGLLREANQASGESPGVSHLDPTIRPEDSPSVVARKVMSSVATRSMRFAQLLATSSDLETLVDRLARCSVVGLFGVGSSLVVAMDLNHRLLRVGKETRCAEDSHTQLAIASTMKPGELGLFFSYSGRTATTVRAAQICHDRGAFTVAVTAERQSPLVTASDLTIATPQGVGLFGNDAVMTRILQILFNEVLFHCLILREPSLLRKLEEVDNVLSKEKL